jgi:hypothetical protein
MVLNRFRRRNGDANLSEMQREGLCNVPYLQGEGDAHHALQQVSAMQQLPRFRFREVWCLLWPGPHEIRVRLPIREVLK